MSGAFTISESCALLERTPALLDAWLRDLPDPWLDADEGEGTFSPREVVGHLVHGERTDWIVRARHILDGRTDPFEPYDRFAQRQDCRPLGELLDSFAELRAHNLDVVRGFGLNDAELERTGRHPELGEVRLRQLLATWVVHDQTHVAQVARVMAKRFAESVGPWAEYLPLLQDRK